MTSVEHPPKKKETVPRQQVRPEDVMGLRAQEAVRDWWHAYIHDGIPPCKFRALPRKWRNVQVHGGSTREVLGLRQKMKKRFLEGVRPTVGGVLLFNL